jgi:hypothetical protein
MEIDERQSFVNIYVPVSNDNVLIIENQGFFVMIVPVTVLGNVDWESLKVYFPCY